MSLAVLIFYKRRSDFTVEQFKAHMENEYLPLLKTAMGEHFPQSVTLRYVERAGTGAGDRFGATMSSKHRNPEDAPVVLVGSPNDVAWDCQCEMIFRDDLQLQQGYAAINSEAGQAVKEEEERFTDSEQMRIVLMEKKDVQGMNLRLPFGFDTDNIDPRSHHHVADVKLLHLCWWFAQIARERKKPSVLDSAAAPVRHEQRRPQHVSNQTREGDKSIS